MKYNHIVQGIFIKRINRFVAHVLIDGVEEVVHVKNTGRCKELFIAGTTVILEKAQNPERKTRFSVIAIYKGNRLINIDSQVPNYVVFEALQSEDILEIAEINRLKKEVTYGNSRFDLYFESVGCRGFIEVKGVTLEEEGLVMFPDAPTVRGIKHVFEMIKAVENGYKGYIFFLIQMKGVKSFSPNSKTDPNFATALQLAAQKGVILLAYDSLVSEDEIVIGDRVDIVL
jgi:sugar fermentation stimulation protein A